MEDIVVLQRKTFFRGALHSINYVARLSATRAELSE